MMGCAVIGLKAAANWVQFLGFIHGGRWQIERTVNR
jgi:hypothetical protein